MGMAMMVCLFFVTGRYFLPLRVLCLAAMIFFGYAFTLTHSRGGFIGLIFGLLSFLLARFGWRKALPFTAALLPALFFLFAGRQTDIDTTQGTGQDRIQLWNDALIAFIRNPLFGLGTGLFQQSAGLVAHNSYLQAYSELGFFGGTLFVGAFYLAVVSLYRLGSCQERIIDPELRRLRPYLVGLVGGFMGCMATMSLTDMLPTYMVLAVVVAYLRVATVRPPLPQLPRFQPGLVLRLAGVSALTLVVFRLYVWFTFIAG
jgi:O-antigen ligase